MKQLPDPPDLQQYVDNAERELKRHGQTLAKGIKEEAANASQALGSAAKRAGEQMAAAATQATGAFEKLADTAVKASLAAANAFGKQAAQGYLASCLLSAKADWKCLAAQDGMCEFLCKTQVSIQAISSSRYLESAVQTYPHYPNCLHYPHYPSASSTAVDEAFAIQLRRDLHDRLDSVLSDFNLASFHPFRISVVSQRSN